LRLVKFFVYAGLFGLGVLAGVALLIRVSLFGSGTSVPHVSGLTREQAEWETQRAKLAFRVQEERYDLRMEKGRVISQSPAPGMSVRKGMTLSVVVSRGIDRLEVPDLRGLRLEAAQIQAQQTGLTPASASYVHSAAPASTVVAQTLAPGAAVPRDQEIGLLVSLGPSSPTFVMPDLRGMDLDQATAGLQEYGILVASARTVALPGVGRNTIVDQEPRPGFPLDRRNVVHLSVSRP